MVLHLLGALQLKKNFGTKNIGDVVGMIDEREVHMEDGLKTNFYHKKIEIFQLCHVILNLLAIFCAVIYNEAWHVFRDASYLNTILNLSVVCSLILMPISYFLKKYKLIY